MRRLCLLVLLIPVLCCRQNRHELKDVLPVEVQRLWTLKETRRLEPDKAPELVRSLGLKRAVDARYEGNGSMAVRVFEMNVDTSAFELMQKWSQADGQAVYTGPYFVTVSGGHDAAAARDFLVALRESIRTGQLR